MKTEKTNKIINYLLITNKNTDLNIIWEMFRMGMFSKEGK